MMEMLEKLVVGVVVVVAREPLAQTTNSFEH